MMASENARDVIIRLRVEQDKNNPRAFQGVGKEAKKTYDQIQKDAKRAADAEAKEFDRLHQRHRQRQQQRARDNRTAREQEIREAERTATAVARAADRAAKAEEAAAKRAEAAHRMANAKRLKQMFDTIKGFEQLGRAAVLFGVVSEESMEKAVKKLAAFEAAVQAAKGITNIVGKERMGSLIGGVGSLVMGGAGRLAPAVGASAVGGGAAAVGGLAAFDIGIILVNLKLFSETLSGSAKNIDSWSNKIAESEVSFGQWIRKTTGLNPFAGIPGGPSGADLDNLTAQEEKIKRMQAAGAHEREMQERSAAVSAIEGAGEREQDRINEDRAAALAGRGLTGTARDEAMNEARRRQIAGVMGQARGELARIDSGGRMPGEDIEATQERAFARLKEQQERLSAVEQERLSIAEKKGKSAVEVEKEALRVSKDRLQQVQSELSALRGRFQSEAERFAELSPGKARQTLEAAKKARAGEELSFSESKLLKGFGEFSGAVDSATERRARELGGGSILDPQRARIDAMAKQETKLQIELKDQTHKVEVTTKNAEQEARQIADQIAQSMVQMLDERTKIIAAEITRQLNQDAQNRNRNQTARDATK